MIRKRSSAGLQRGRKLQRPHSTIGRDRPEVSTVAVCIRSAALDVRLRLTHTPNVHRRCKRRASEAVSGTA
ncbi:MAG: hypothetical protein FD127_371 [Acidimicrobiaceae bacterium]|nr:MAG: hypothetical protein FD127_371 [Acidimicrobiaceae bacterium]